MGLGSKRTGQSKITTPLHGLVISIIELALAIKTSENAYSRKIISGFMITTRYHICLFCGTSILTDSDLQLNLQMVAGKAFHFYSEGPVFFPPTYKYDIGKNEYDTS